MNGKCNFTECINGTKKASDIKNELTSGSAKGIYKLENLKIEEKFDLRHLVIQRPIILRNCIFQDEVDFRNCEFERTVHIERCKFNRVFNSGNLEESKVIYRRDLICNNSEFDDSIWFIGVQCEDSGFFIGTKFNQEVDLQGGYFRNSLKFRDAVFKKKVNLSWVHVGKNLKCTNAQFHGNADFNNIQVEGAAYFSKAEFTGQKSDIDFSLATFGRYLNFTEAKVSGNANFKNVQINGDGFFNETEFKNPDEEAKFNRSAFGQNLEFKKAVFEGGANFSLISCDGNGVFELTKFQNESKNVDFKWSKFERNLNFSEAEFKGSANFRGVRCELGGNFKKLQCEGEITFAGASFGENMDFQDARFYSTKKVNFALVHVTDKMNLINAEFNGEVSFYNAQINVLKLGDGESPFKANTLELSDCVIRNFKEEDSANQKELYKQSLRADSSNSGRSIYNSNKLKDRPFFDFVQKQSPDTFTREPFIQLEKYFQKIGDEVQAQKAYVAGRKAIRKQAKCQDSIIEWSRPKLIVDFLIKCLTMYGARTIQLLPLILVLLAFNTWLFWPLDRLDTKKKTVWPAYFLELNTCFANPECETVQKIKRGVILAVYSVDLFIPLVDLQLAKKLEPAGPMLKTWSAVYIVLGWLLIPLLLASITGVVKKQ